MNWWRKIWELNRPFHRTWLGLIGFILAGQILAMAWPLFGGLIVDGLIKHKTLIQLGQLILLLLGLSWLRSFIKTLEITYNQRHLENDLIQHFSRITMEKYADWSIGQHRGKHSGIKKNVADQGMNAFINLSSAVVNNFLPMALTFVLSLLALLYYSWLIALLVAILSSGYFLILTATNRRFLPQLKDNEKRWKDWFRSSSEVLNNIGVILANSQGDRIINEVDKSYSVVSRQDKKIWIGYLRRAASSSYYSDLATALVVVLGLILVSCGTLTAGKLITIIWWSNSLFGNLSSLRYLHRNYLFWRTKTQEYFDMLDIEPDVKIVNHPIKVKTIGQIKFSDVSFAYPEHDKAGDDIDFADKKTSNGRVVLHHASL